MITISAKKREQLKQDLAQLRQQGNLPAVVYGPETKNVSILLNAKDFAKAFEAAGETDLLTLDVEGTKISVLVKEIAKDPVGGFATHVDFYAPNLKQETEVTVPLEFVGEAGAVKELHGTLVKNLHELDIKCLPQDIPHSIVVDIAKLATFEDHFCVKDLSLGDKVKVLRGADDIIAFVAKPADVAAELEKAIEGDVDKVEKIEKPKEEEVPETPAAQ